ncbi:MAG: efflux RND transporter periplasmic adaptor subunit [Armatimonadota bacterium]
MSAGRMQRTAAVLIPLIAIGGATAWRLNVVTKEKAAAAKEGPGKSKRTPNVTTAPVEVRDIVTTISVVGDISAVSEQRIAPRVTGRLLELFVDEGDTVKAGQLLARIDGNDIAQQIARAEAQLFEAERRIEQATLAAKPAATNTKEVLAQQKNAQKVADATLRQSERNADLMVGTARSAVADAQARVDAADAAVATAKAAKTSADANLTNAIARQKRVASLNSRGFVSSQELDNASTDVKVREANLAAATSNVEAALSNLKSSLALLTQAQKQLELADAKSKTDIEVAKFTYDSSISQVRAADANMIQAKVAQKNIKALEGTRDAARAALDALRQQQTQLSLVAATDGIVSQRIADPGTMLTAGTPVLVVQSSGAIQLDCLVDPDTATKLRIGAMVEVSTSDDDKQTIPGRIDVILPSADSGSRQLRVRVVMINPPPTLRAGGFARVTFETGRVNGAIVAPREAIKRTKAGTVAAVVDGEGNVSVRDVTLGTEDGKGIQILSGLAAGDMVVTMSFAPPKDGTKVNVIAPDAGGKDDKGSKGDKSENGEKIGKDKSGQGPAAGSSK